MIHLGREAEHELHDLLVLAHLGPDRKVVGIRHALRPEGQHPRPEPQRHGRDRRQPARTRLTDLNSTNGTFVNRKRIEGSCLLQENDIIHFFTAEFRLRRH
ncbi:MAG: FHA domain-containing protein, partial [Xanthomonadales bacterium]|nr:FHA domain-containing protein [Xanthomonadales bacterium]